MKETLWLPKATVISDEAKQLAQEIGRSERFAQLCYDRGLTTAAAITTFLSPETMPLHDPMLMYDMAKCVERLQRAIYSGEQIVVYGDYDADGITSTTILIEAINMLGGEVSFYLPNRFRDGYGPNISVYERLIAEGAQLILTCDNGVAGHEAIAYAMSQGVDVIVTDHHELPDVLPDAYAIVHPRHPLGSYPFGDLAGVGVAFKVACALLDDVPEEFLDLVAIGTIADVVSLTDENRALVARGLRHMQVTERLGLVQLLAKRSSEDTPIDETTVGFFLGPRLNALGRLADATPGVTLLTSFDEEEISPIIQLVEETNRERQALVERIATEAQEQIVALGERPSAVVLADKTWHAGVLGIVASRLVEQYDVPVVLLAIDEQKQVAKGSGRSPERINLYQLLTDVSEHLIAFGGHHAAAGMTIASDQIATVATLLNERAASVAVETPSVVTVDQVLPVSDVSLDFIRELQLLKPFGCDNLEPEFLFPQVTTTQVKFMGLDKQHLRLTVTEADASIDVLKFQVDDSLKQIQVGTNLTLTGKLVINEWQGIQKPQVLLRRAKVEGLQVFDWRRNRPNEAALAIDDAVYVFDNPKSYEKFHPQLPANSQAVRLYEQSDWKTVNKQVVVIFDCPADLLQLERFLKQCDVAQIYVMSYSWDQVYAQGIPTREQFKIVYQWLRQQQSFTVRDRLDAGAKQLRLSRALLIFILQVFSEVEFVTIENGVLHLVPEPKKVNLFDAPLMKRRQQQMMAEKQLIYSQFAAVNAWLTERLMGDN